MANVSIKFRELVQIAESIKIKGRPWLTRKFHCNESFKEKRRIFLVFTSRPEDKGIICQEPGGSPMNSWTVLSQEQSGSTPKAN